MSTIVKPRWCKNNLNISLLSKKYFITRFYLYLQCKLIKLTYSLEWINKVCETCSICGQYFHTKIFITKLNEVMYINSVILAFCNPLGGSIFHLTLDREIIQGVSRCIVTYRIKRCFIKIARMKYNLNSTSNI